jgi:hypothetical protein
MEDSTQLSIQQQVHCGKANQSKQSDGQKEYKMNATIHFLDASTMNVINIKNFWMDDFGVHMDAMEGKVFIPYGSIKFISEVNK